jgi:hypothetical protein
LKNKSKDTQALYLFSIGKTSLEIWIELKILVDYGNGINEVLLSLDPPSLLLESLSASGFSELSLSSLSSLTSSVASGTVVPRSPSVVASSRSLSVGEISGIIKGVSVLSDCELSVVAVSEVDDDDDDLSSQLVGRVRLRDGSHKIVLPYSWTGGSKPTIKNNEKINRTEFNTVKVTLIENVELHAR